MHCLQGIRRPQADPHTECRISAEAYLLGDDMVLSLSRLKERYDPGCKLEERTRDTAACAQLLAPEVQAALAAPQLQDTQRLLPDLCSPLLRKVLQQRHVDFELLDEPVLWAEGAMWRDLVQAAWLTAQLDRQRGLQLAGNPVLQALAAAVSPTPPGGYRAEHWVSYWLLACKRCRLTTGPPRCRPGQPKGQAVEVAGGLTHMQHVCRVSTPHVCRTCC